MEKRVVGYIGVVVAVILLCLGLFIKIPPKEISFRDVEEYVGGDAYNIQIEASLKGGEIAGAKTAKAVYISCAAIIFIFSLSLISHSKQDVNIQNGDMAQENGALGFLSQLDSKDKCEDKK